jgi:endonuclease/exonuclease/phosphatase (EEP) superfamily protein YafD
VRRRFIIGAQQDLYEAIAEVASEVIANEFRTRCLERLVVRKRRAAVDRVLERRRQFRAWREIEDSVREIELIQPSSPMKKKKRSIDEVVVVKNRSNNNNNSTNKSISKIRRIEPSARRIPATSLEIESLRAMMASAAQLLEWQGIAPIMKPNINPFKE